ncbi:MAG: ATP-dependent Clp protease ATP-binding subunit [Prevotella sp.]|nr:ATP-dependent Clp protease ATP-binding subunit [Prevotella sp.]
MYINPFSAKINEILANSKDEAMRLASPYIAPEHLLLAMLREQNGLAQEMLTYADADINAVRTALEESVRNDDIAQVTNNNDLMLGETASNLLKLAVLEARIQRAKSVSDEHLFLAMLHNKTRNNVKEILENNNMTYEDTLNYLKRKQSATKNGIGLPEEEDEDFANSEPSSKPENNNGRQQATGTQTKKTQSKTPVIDNFATDLTAAAAEGKLDPCVGRENEIQRVTEILCRRKKNNPILIGEPGVGKSAIVEGLAQFIASHKTSPVLFNKRLVNLDMSGMVAGTKYRGQFEERIKQLIKELEQNPDIIIFIDEIHTLIGAGSAQGSMDAANIMKPALARGTIQCIGATTLDEYRNSIEKDGALERRFQKVLVEPTTTEQTLEILNNIKGHYEQHHHVDYTKEALEACVNLTERYVTDRFFPDKAIDAMDEVGARVHLQHAVIPPSINEKEREISYIKEKKLAAVNNQNFELAASYRDRQTELEAELETLNKQWSEGDNSVRETITEKEVADVVSMMTGVPVQRMAEAEGIRLKNMAEELKKSVVAQDEAIEKMVKAIQRNRIGLKEPNHPIGVFMFLGPTGVGKTYLAKKLAEIMFGSTDALIRIDMSEYTESFNTSRLIGAPPGYVGYEEGGQLTERVRRHPYSIVLLDEIEKAHGNVFNMLLQVLDEGRLTDGNGRLIDFRNTVIIMTSNSGTRQLKEFGRGIGFTAGGTGVSLNEADKIYARQIIQKSLSRQFAPEFLNRLDEIITFDQLDMNAIKRIIDIELKGLYSRIENLGYHLSISDDAKEFVASKGYDVQFGARPLKRAIQNYIEDGVCERILANDIHPGDTILITKNTEKEELTFE